MKQLTALLCLFFIGTANAQFGEVESIKFKTGPGVNYLAVCLYPNAGLSLTDDQKVELIALQKKMLAVRNFEVDPLQSFEDQRQSYSDNQADRRKIDAEIHKATFDVLNDGQKKRVRQLKLQLDLQNGFFGAVFDSLGIRPTEKQRAALSEELTYAPIEAESRYVSLKRKMIRNGLQKIIGADELDRLEGKPFFFRENPKTPRLRPLPNRFTQKQK